MSDLLAKRAAAADLVRKLQARHVDRLTAAASALNQPVTFEAVSWLRDGGVHGGGTRMQAMDTATFDRASVNVSVVHYDDVPTKPLSSACALSAIVHPRHPHAPSMHLHTSWTSTKDGRGGWRIMADLNPSIDNPAHAERFRSALAQAAGRHWEQARDEGDRYFAIPALGRTRGIVHAYLEGFDSGDFDADLDLAHRVEAAAIDTYAELVKEGAASVQASEEDRRAQLHYHTLYVFQVLTLDRGTTSGLLVHGDNDIGILGSLPGHVDRDLFASWADRVPPIQRDLVLALAAALPQASPAPVDEATKIRMADAVRAFYRARPEALDLQARGSILPPTVSNHTG